MGGRGCLGYFGMEGWGGDYFFPHPNELFIWAYPENLVKFGLLVEAVGNFLQHGDGNGHGTGQDDTLLII